MFYSDVILSKRGPLAQVWLAAHMERKLSKAQTIKTDIGDSVEVILNQPAEPMALRMSGQLLLGVTRIYSRKTKYLLDDCNEALMRIRMAFRPGQVELTADQVIMSNNAITLPDAGNNFLLDFGDLNADWDLPRFHHNPTHLTNHNEVSIPDPANLSLDWRNQVDISYDGGLLDGGFQPSEFDPSEYDMNDSVERGRRDSSQAPSLFGGSDFFGVGKHNEDNLSVHSQARSVKNMSIQDYTNDFHPEPFEPLQDIDLGMGEGGIEFEWGDDLAPAPNADNTANQEEVRTVRQPSRPPSPAQMEEEVVPPKPKKKKAVKFHKAIVDQQIEEGINGRAESNAAVDVSSFTTRHPRIPSTSQEAYYQQVLSQPQTFFGATFTNAQNEIAFHCAPLDLQLADEVMEVFTFQISSLRKRSLDDALNPPSKRNKADDAAAFHDDDLDVEIGRRRQNSFGAVDGNDISFSGFDDNVNDYVPEVMDDNAADPFDNSFDPEPLSISRRSRSRTPAAVSTVSYDVDEALDMDKFNSAIMIFDSRSALAHQLEESASQGTPSTRDGRDSHKRSKNTFLALNFLKENLPDDKASLSFQDISKNSTRRAASSFFYELLLLTSQKAVKLNQETAFGDIVVAGQENLWRMDDDSL